jgi:endonuclease/exonuclease/phosphatase (EEP) superfamily protein YafD
MPPESFSLRPLLKAAWNLILAAILLYGLGVTGYWAARLIAGERWNWIAFANNFVPWWALGGLIAGGIAAFSRWRWGLIALQTPGIVAFLICYAPLLLPHSPTAVASDAPILTVATYNIEAITSDPQRVLDVTAGLDADIIGLEEVGPVHAALFEKELIAEYPYQALYPKLPVHGVGLLSRYPILSQELIPPFPDSMLYLRATLDVNGDLITIYVVHPPPPRQFISPLTYDDSRRDAEITILKNRYLVHETGPVIVLGDFNMTDQSDAYQIMDDLFDDTFRTVGWGLGFTFPDKIRSSIRIIPRLIRIDYVWYNAYFAASGIEVGSDSGTSDHRPVVAQLVLKPKE